MPTSGKRAFIRLILAAKLTADLDELTSETSLLDDQNTADEIPEDEQIKERISD